MAMPSKAHEEDGELSEMNLTPFIDVILVLLIIFMIAAHSSAVSQTVDLPGSRAAPLAVTKPPVVLTIRADKSILLNDHPIGSTGLAVALARAGTDPKDRVLLAGDKAVSYDKLMEVLDDLRAGGYTHIGLVGVERGIAK
ncbi:biopolymer transport protein ExbD [Rhizomicrobium palustre]|uniref:Biopolymer transport protein ExbD n=1 Tax=Rhizomicrobium palustre TaxID=189966 RepID=A0A846MY14_9PROT|nr:biopolymer transporter ExbD [Rhizomicrobium palustre]NIK88504.1 biopolymer transport protein ExbD [Rhizomicrobium palustre]